MLINFIAFLDESEPILNQKKLGLERYAEPPLPAGKFQTFYSFFKRNLPLGFISMENTNKAGNKKYTFREGSF